MANFDNIKNRIDRDITGNGQGDITGPVLNSVLKAMLDAVAGQLYITSYDYANSRVTMSDGTHSKVYQLTPYIPTPDYFVGFAGGSSDDFRAMTVDDLMEAVINKNGDTVSERPTYQGTWNNNTLFVLIRGGVDITSATYTSAGGGGAQPIELDMTPPHENVTVNGILYQVKSRRLPSPNLWLDTFSVTFNSIY